MSPDLAARLLLLLLHEPSQCYTSPCSGWVRVIELALARHPALACTACMHAPDPTVARHRSKSEAHATMRSAAAWHPRTHLQLWLQVCILHQLTSALEAMHRHHFATPVLHALSLASIHLAFPDSATPSVRIMPYALSAPKATPQSPIVSMLEALCVPPEATAGMAIVNEAKGDVWRVAAVAVVAIAGEVVFDCMDDDGAGAAASLLDVVVSRLQARSDGRAIPANLASILRVRADHRST